MQSWSLIIQHMYDILYFRNLVLLEALDAKNRPLLFEHTYGLAWNSHNLKE